MRVGGDGSSSTSRGGEKETLAAFSARVRESFRSTHDDDRNSVSPANEGKEYALRLSSTTEKNNVGGGDVSSKGYRNVEDAWEQKEEAQSSMMRPAKDVSSADAAMACPSSIFETFMKNEIYFKELFQQRAMVLRNVESLLKEAHDAVESCKSENVQLGEKLQALDNAVQIEKQRRVTMVAREGQVLEQLRSRAV